MSKTVGSIKAPFDPDYDISFADCSGDLAYVSGINGFLSCGDGIFKFIEKTKVIFATKASAPFSFLFTPVYSYVTASALASFFGRIVATFSPTPDAGFRIVMQDRLKVFLRDRFFVSHSLLHQMNG